MLKSKSVGSEFTNPFGLEGEELDPESSDYFQTVTVDLRRRKLTGGGNVHYPRIILPKKGRRSGSGGWVTIGDNTKRYQVNRSSSLEDLLEDTPRRRRYANVPGMASHLAGAIVNDALDRLFGYRGHDPRTVSVYYKRESESSPPPAPMPASRPCHYR